MSFCEIRRDAALSVAEAVADKVELEKLDLNGNRGGGLGTGLLAGPGPRPDPLFPPLRAGNTLGEEGCEQLQEVLDGFNMARVLASLR